MSDRHIDVFFYGLFMDDEILREAGAEPINPRRVCVEEFALRIGQRVTLVPSAGARAYGMLFGLPPFWWTLSKRRIGCPECKSRRRVVWAASARVTLDQVLNYIAESSYDGAHRVLHAALDLAASLTFHPVTVRACAHLAPVLWRASSGATSK